MNSIKDFKVGDILLLSEIGLAHASRDNDFINKFATGKCVIINIRKDTLIAQSPDGEILHLSCYDWYKIKRRGLNCLVQK